MGADPNSGFSLEDRIRVLMRTLGFEKVGPDDLRPLAGLAGTTVYSRGELIFAEGDPAEMFRVVARGRVKVAKSAPSGRLFTSVVAAPGDTLNAVVLFDGSPHFLSARALDRATVLSLPRPDFLSFVADHPPVAVGIISVLGRIVKSDCERAMAMIDERVEARVAKVLFMLLSKFGERLDFTARELADLAGTTTESALRVLAQLREEGLIRTERGRITILDPDRLCREGRTAFVI